MNNKARSILIVEDDTEFCNSLKVRLESREEKLKLYFAESAEEGLKIFQKNNKIEVVISDLNLPKNDGVWLAKKMLNKNIRFIILTCANSLRIPIDVDDTINAFISKTKLHILDSVLDEAFIKRFTVGDMRKLLDAIPKNLDYMGITSIEISKESGPIAGYVQSKTDELSLDCQGYGEKLLVLDPNDEGNSSEGIHISIDEERKEKIIKFL